MIEKLNNNIAHGQTATMALRSTQKTSTTGNMTKQNLLASGKIAFEHQSSNPAGGSIASNDIISKVLNEKENYICNLENEISEMRKEIEI